MKRFFILFLIFFLTACTSATPSANSTAQVGGTPAGYPAPEVPTEAPTATIDPGMGQLHGQMLVKGQPVTTGILYLAELIKDNEGKEIVASFSRESKIRADFDANGNFTFRNVPPGRYGMIYDVVTNAYLLMFPDRQDSLIVEIKMGEDQNLGVMDYPNFPDSTP